MKNHMLTYRRSNHLEVIMYSYSNFVGCVDTRKFTLSYQCYKNDKYSKGATNHMKLKYFAMNEEVHKQRVSIKHISTNLMIVDSLTKGLLPKTFIENVKTMGIIINNGCFMNY
ncbi:hypothetical protein CR513_49627, partial [Mucuna pruriens]